MRSQLRQRILTAMWLIPLALVCVLMPTRGAYYPMWLGVQGLVAVILLLGGLEWARMMQYSSTKTLLFSVCLGTLLLLMIVFYPVIPPDMVWTISIMWWGIALLIVLRYQAKPFKRLIPGTRFITGLLLLVPTFFAFLYLKQAHSRANLLLITLIVVWCADTGAYFAGKAWGKHKLMDKVSPGKTAEGLFGGLVTAWVVGLVLSRGSFYWMGWVTIIVLASVLGDLTESLFKRVQGVKDSGHLLPGHGGILDRIDSLTAALPIGAMTYWSML